MEQGKQIEFKSNSINSLNLFCNMVCSWIPSFKNSRLCFILEQPNAKFAH